MKAFLERRDDADGERHVHGERHVGIERDIENGIEGKIEGDLFIQGHEQAQHHARGEVLLQLGKVRNELQAERRLKTDVEIGRALR